MLALSICSKAIYRCKSLLRGRVHLRPTVTSTVDVLMAAHPAPRCPSCHHGPFPYLCDFNSFQGVPPSLTARRHNPSRQSTFLPADGVYMRPMSSDHGKTALVFRLDAPSSPARVAAVAKLIDDMLRSVAPNLAEGDVTMVVDNFLSKSGVRPRSPAARKAVQLVLRFLDNPIKVAKKHPETRALARVLRDQGKQFQELNAEFVRGGGRKAVTTLNDEFVRTMAAVVHGTPRPQSIWQGIQIQSVVLRVGRLHEDSKHDAARIVLDGIEVDFRLEATAVTSAYRAAEDRAQHVVDIDAAYTRAVDGRMVLDSRASRIVRIGRPIHQFSGAAMMKLLQESAPSLADVPLDEPLWEAE